MWNRVPARAIPTYCLRGPCCSTSLLPDLARSGRNSIPHDFHKNQVLFTAEPLNYQFSSLAAGEGGRNIYHGGGRQPSVGGSFRVIKRRIPLGPPLSLGAFENAIAVGFRTHFGEVDNAWGRVGPDSDPDTAGLCPTNGHYGFSNAGQGDRKFLHQPFHRA